MQAGEALTSHSHWVTDLAWHPIAPHQLLSASYDRTVKQWDVRAAVPLHTLAAHTDKVRWQCSGGPSARRLGCRLQQAAGPCFKQLLVWPQVFAVCWADSQTVASGGADSQLHFFSSSSS